MQKGIRKAVSTTKGNDMPSTPELVDEAGAEPAALLDELERGGGRVELRPGVAGESEHDAGGGQRRPFRITAASPRPLPRSSQDEAGADEGQDDQAGQDAEAEHQRAPASRNQVISTVTPISMAKA